MSPYKSSTTDGMALARLTWMRGYYYGPLRSLAAFCGILRCLRYPWAPASQTNNDTMNKRHRLR